MSQLTNAVIPKVGTKSAAMWVSGGKDLCSVVKMPRVTK